MSFLVRIYRIKYTYPIYITYLLSLTLVAKTSLSRTKAEKQQRIGRMTAGFSNFSHGARAGIIPASDNIA